jgi:methionyl-tRNA formyltransferase
MRTSPSPVKALALARGIEVLQPPNLSDPHTHSRLAAVKADAMIVAAYGLILPSGVLEVARHGAINIHASLLPRWRGAAPIHRAIEAGDAETGVTIMQMDEGLDTGDMLLAERTPIAPDDTTGRLHDRLAALGARMIVQALPAAAAGELAATPQPAEGVTYAHKIDKAEAAIDWAGPAEAIERRVRAFDPFPGASFEAGGETVKLWRAMLRPDLQGLPGQVIKADGQELLVACGQGGLSLQELQRPGGRRLPAAAYMQSRPDLQGTRLGRH